MAFQQKHFHFIGICGTAMGSVAAALQDQGHTVTGSDSNIYPPISDFLKERNVRLFNGYRSENLPAGADCIVVGNAISRGNPELEAALDQRLYYTSLPEIIKENFLRGKKNFVVTGTHGKTTTTSILTWLMESARLQPGYFIGGIPNNLGQGARFHDSEHVVLEGDEYDTAYFDKRSKFLHYLPEVVIINNIEFDHADIFNNLEEIQLSFRRLLNLVPRNGCVFVNGDDANSLEVTKACLATVVKVGFHEACEARITDVIYTADASQFNLLGDTYRLPMVGEFNVRNAAMAVCAALFANLTPAQIETGLTQFTGVARRQELRGEVRGIKVIDDFGHHPTAIRGTVTGIRQQYPGAKVWAVFEPRSNTMRRNFYQKALSEALSLADGAVICAVSQPEKVAPEERMNPEQVVAAVRAAGHQAYCEANADEIVNRLKPLVSSGDVILVFSNGGFDNIHEKLLQRL